MKPKFMSDLIRKKLRYFVLRYLTSRAKKQNWGAGDPNWHGSQSSIEVWGTIFQYWLHRFLFYLSIIKYLVWAYKYLNIKKILLFRLVQGSITCLKKIGSVSPFSRQPEGSNLSKYDIMNLYSYMSQILYKMPHIAYLHVAYNVFF